MSSEYLEEKFPEILFELGISDIHEFLCPPFTLIGNNINYINVTTVFNTLVKDNGLEALGLEIYLIDTTRFVESKANKQSHIILVVSRGELIAAETIDGIAAMLAPHLFTYASYLLYQRFILPHQQEEEADLAGLLIMQNIGYDISEAEVYRKRQTKTAMKQLRGIRIAYREFLSSEEYSNIMLMIWKKYIVLCKDRFESGSLKSRKPKLQLKMASKMKTKERNKKATGRTKKVTRKNQEETKKHETE
ncbi:hypothetical protein BDZ45DRAFT_734222 [Acephala macrosclerotiorum]|nr:hypothetical protein BDZ45DRAFT_734222 [Acephala macrosclerotiorum]